jgi:archaellum component FlaC
MASDELKIVLEDVKEKFDTVIEAFNMVKETLDRHIEENRKEHQEFKMAILNVEANVSEIRKDLNDHRDNTELHAGERRKKA